MQQKVLEKNTLEWLEDLIVTFIPVTKLKEMVVQINKFYNSHILLNLQEMGIVYRMTKNSISCYLKFPPCQSLKYASIADGFCLQSERSIYQSNEVGLHWKIESLQTTHIIVPHSNRMYIFFFCFAAVECKLALLPKIYRSRYSIHLTWTFIQRTSWTSCMHFEICNSIHIFVCGILGQILRKFDTNILKVAPFFILLDCVLRCKTLIKERCSHVI